MPGTEGVSKYLKRERNGWLQRCHSLNTTLLRGFNIRWVCPYFGRLTESLTVHAELYTENLSRQQHVKGNRVRSGTKLGESPAVFQVKCNLKTWIWMVIEGLEKRGKDTL